MDRRAKLRQGMARGRFQGEPPFVPLGCRAERAFNQDVQRIHIYVWQVGGTKRSRPTAATRARVHSSSAF
jgi:hypothetical protein